MEKKELVCIVCPIGCHLEVDGIEGDYKVSGANCKRGEAYAIKELSNPTRLLTSTVKIKGGDLPRLPVRTDKEIPKDKVFEYMEAINKVELEAPVKMGQVILQNIFNSDINIIASRSMN